MAKAKIENIDWYRDEAAAARGEPGIYHSYLSALATALKHVAGELDAVRLMGGSAFAFRIFAHELMCPSAMSVFNWSEILPEAVEQMGYQCGYISRLWHEGAVAREKRDRAHHMLVEAVAREVPGVVWDIADAEWGLVTGYDDERQLYETLTHRGQEASLPYTKLGRNGIDILSVVVPGEPNGRPEDEIVVRSLRKAIVHAEQKEWMERPAYQDGPPAYDLWALLYDRWAQIVEAGKSDNIDVDIHKHSVYYAGHHYAARCYAREYLRRIAGGDETLEKAADVYARVAEYLRPTWEFQPEGKEADPDVLRGLSETIRAAKAAEEEGLDHIREYTRQKV